MSDEPAFASTPDGRRLYVDPADARARELVAAGGNLNPLSLELWQQVLSANPWDVVIDVGVNYGEMLVAVDLPPGATLIGFEPNPVIRDLVTRTLLEAGLDVDLRPHAVADRPGTARFAVDEAWSGTSSLAGEQATAAGHTMLDVPVTSLDLVVPPHAASFCVKVDVEGFEAQVLAGARSVRARTTPWVLMLETLHMAPGQFATMVAGDAAVLLRREDRRLVHVPVPDLDVALTSGEFYPQDGLVLNAAALDVLDPA